MKLMYDTTDISFEQELAEDTEKKYRIKGIFSSPGRQNKNGRVYPMNIWESEVQKYQEVLKSGHPNCLMELEHPPRSNVDMMEAVAKMEKLYIENGYVMGEAVLLDNPKANQLKTLIDNGIKMSVSSRGLGSVKNGLVESFKLITFDIIANLGQSDYAAEMYGIVEGVLQNKEFLITESGEIREIIKEEKEEKTEIIPEKPVEVSEVETKTEITTEVKPEEISKEQLQEEILNKFKNIFKNTKINEEETYNIDKTIEAIEKMIENKKIDEKSLKKCLVFLNFMKSSQSLKR